jgi:hypothetical protein
MAGGNIGQHYCVRLESDPMKESEGKKKIKPPQANASQPSLKGRAATPKLASKAKGE